VHRAELLRTSLPPGCPDVAQRGAVLVAVALGYRTDSRFRDRVAGPELSLAQRSKALHGALGCRRVARIRNWAMACRARSDVPSDVLGVTANASDK